MIALSFHQTKAQFMVRIASTMIFNTLQRNGYPFVPLSELAENPQYGYTAKSFEDGIDGVNPHLVRITDLQDDKIDWRTVPYCEAPDSTQYLLKPNDILFARTGATTGKTHLIKEVPSSAVFASYLIRIRPRDRVFAGYLYAFFQSDNYWSQIIDQKQGSAQPNVNGQKLASLFLPQIEPELQQAIFSFIQAVRKRQDGDLVELPSLPEPLSEQQRIVAKIEQLAAKIEEARGLRSTNTENTEALFISRRAQIIAEAFKTGKRAITEVANLERGKFTHRPRNEPRFFGGKHPWIQIGEIEAANKYILTWLQTLNDDGLSISKKFPKGTLLISIAATIGAVGILDFDCCIPDSIVAITPKQNTESEFLYHYLGYLRTHLEELAPQSAQKNINLRILSELPFPQISVDEQRRIVAYLDGLQAQVDRLKALQAQTAAELEALLPSILDKAFKGEL